MLLLFLLAAGLMSYPFLSNLMFEVRAGSYVKEIAETAENMNASGKKRILREAYQYNESLACGNVRLTDPFIAAIPGEKKENYCSVLSADADGVMGSIEIPVIGVRLPIYHGTTEEVLQKGAGHLYGTSLPVGGESTHSVLTGHTGIGRAKLFTDLTAMEKGDGFFLHIWGETLAYETDQIKIVRPADLSDLYIESGKDYCTLVTCTPYGVNSHRLLVRGERVSDPEKVKNEAADSAKDRGSEWMREYLHALWISLAAFLTGFLGVTFFRWRRNGVKNDRIWE